MKNPKHRLELNLRRYVPLRFRRLVRAGTPFALSAILLVSSLATGATSGLDHVINGLIKKRFENPKEATQGPTSQDGLVPTPFITPQPYVETETNLRHDNVRGELGANVVPAGACAIPDFSNRFRVEVPEFVPVFSGQESPENCWAACAEMVLAAQGVHHTQDRMVEKLRSRPSLYRSLTGLTNNVADLAEICGVIEDLDPGSAKSRILATALEKSMHSTVRDLASGVPVIACLSIGGRIGHAYVIEGMTVTIFQPSLGALQSVLSHLFCKNPWNALRWFPWAYNPLSPNETALVSSQLGSGFALRDAMVTYRGVELASLETVIPDMTKYHDMYFSGDDPFAQTRVCVHEVTLADPFPGRQPRFILSGEDFDDRLQYLIRIRVF